MSKLDCVSFRYFATGTLRDSIVVGEEAANGTSCAVEATAVSKRTIPTNFLRVRSQNSLSG